MEKTTCYMCACRCGINVYLKDGKVRYIDGNRDHPVNKGVLCGKGSAGIMQHYSPARLKAPLKRVGPRGSGEFKEISWEEALQTATDWLGKVRAEDPKKLAFFTGRDQSQSLTGWWAIKYGTPNYAAHGGFCSVNMAAAGLYTFGGSFWEFGEPDWDHAKFFMLFGVAEDHSSNPIKIGLGKLKANGAKIVSVNPVRTGYNAVADEWVGIRPGTDGAFVGALIHELLRTQRIDIDYLVRYTNAPWLVIEAPGAADHGMFVRDEKGNALAFEQTITLDVPWTDIHGRRHEKMVGRPVAMHAMRGISAHSNGFQTCRLIHILQILLGSIDCPGGFRYKPPYPKEIAPRLKPTGKPGQVKAGEPLPGPHLGFPTSPADLLIDAAHTPQRIDKAYSWDAPLAAHGLMHMVITNAALGDPYPIDTLFMYMANMSWNSSMNIRDTLKYLTDKNPETGEYKIPRIIYSDAYYSEMVPYADLILPDTTYLERWDCISILDRPISEPDAACDAIRHPVIEPDRDVRGFQSVLLDLGARLKLPGLVKEDGSPQFPGGYADYLVNHERAPGIGPLAGWRGNGDSFGKGAPNPDQLNRYIANGGFHAHHLPPSQRYFKHANKEYLDWAASVGFRAADAKMTFQLYCEPLQAFRLAAEGHGPVQPPESHRERIAKYFDPLPFWYQPFEGTMVDTDKFPMHAITQRPMHMYHSWGSQNAWLRQITGQNRLYMSRARGKELGIADDDWVWISSYLGRVRCQVRLMDGVNDQTAWTWNAIGKRKGAWGLSNDAPEATRGFLLNHLISELLPAKGGGYRYSNSDPITGQAAWYDLRVHIEKAAPEAIEQSEPRFEPFDDPIGRGHPDVIAYGAEFKRARR
ncbi:MAG: formate dehydrogenase [Hyphomicrobium sp. SCN 65-11]|nr:MAG: formate dehydrogenase [Hyphomicrobium sp. SCN 65-11]